jgi:hypothetical protein
MANLSESSRHKPQDRTRLSVGAAVGNSRCLDIANSEPEFPRKYDPSGLALSLRMVDSMAMQAVSASQGW